MNASLIFDNLGLVMLGILACIVIVLLPVIVSAARRSRRRKESVDLRDSEPSVYGDRYYDGLPEDGYAAGVYGEDNTGERWRARVLVDDEPPPRGSRAQPRSRQDARRSKPRREAPTPNKRSVGGRFAWFLIGVCVGAGGLALWWSPPSVGSLATVMPFLDRPDPPASAGDRSPQETFKTQDRFGTAHSESVAAPAASAGSGGNEVGEWSSASLPLSEISCQWWLVQEPPW